MPQNLKDAVRQLTAEQHAEVVAIRRHLHANPELSYQEHQTSAYVARQLEQMGIPFRKGYVKTGIVGLIEGCNPKSKTVALRADLDALPIREENEVPYRSRNEGVMHACGHDVHTASLLGTAMVLNRLKKQFSGTVKLIFQPGEERLPGGASLMIKEGALQNPTPERIFGQHVFPELETGKVGFRSGIYMASCDEIYVTVHGKGGHGALPHKTIDPVLMASHIIVALQQLVSRNANPETPTVLSFGRIVGNGSTNVIPNEVKLEGTFRTFDETWRSEAHAKMKAMAEQMAESMGGSCTFRIERGYPFLINHPATTARAKAQAQAFLGAENVVDLGLRMTAEDFAYYAQQMPACFYRLGVANKARGITHPVHTSEFDIDEKALETGVGLMAWLALSELENK